MKTLKQIISLILMLVLVMSAVFNILYLFNIIGDVLLQTGFFILIFVEFLISVLGLIMKRIRKEDSVSINIIMPAKEIGGVYIVMLLIWLVTYFIAIIFK